MNNSYKKIFKDDTKQFLDFLVSFDNTADDYKDEDEYKKSKFKYFPRAAQYIHFIQNSDSKRIKYKEVYDCIKADDLIQSQINSDLDGTVNRLNYNVLMVEDYYSSGDFSGELGDEAIGLDELNSVCRNIIDDVVAILYRSVSENVQVDVSEELKNVEKENSANTITILGIFTAIAFAVFGSVTALGSLPRIINYKKAEADVNIGMMLVFGSIIGLITYGIFIILFNGISKLVHNRDPKVENGYKISPVSYCVLIVLLVMFISGVLFALKVKVFPSFSLYLDHLMTIVLIVAAIVIAIFVAWLLIKRSCKCEKN